MFRNIKSALGKELRANLYINNFNKQLVSVDLLKIAQKINPQKSGGHKYACGFAFPKDLTVVVAQNLITKEFELRK